MQIDLRGELTKWLSSPEVQDLLSELLKRVVRSELKTMLHDELVDVREAASILNISETAVRKAAERGQLRFLKIGGRVRFRRTDLLHP